MKFKFQIDQISVRTEEDVNITIDGVEMTVEMTAAEMTASTASMLETIKAFSAAAASNTGCNDIEDEDEDVKFVAYVLYRNGMYAAFGSEGWTFTYDAMEASLFDTIEKAELRKRCTPQFAEFNVVKRVKEII